MAWMSANVHMETRSAGGLGKMLGRALRRRIPVPRRLYLLPGPGSRFVCSEFPGKIVPLDLGPGQEIIAQKDAFMCAEKSVELAIHFRKRLGAGFFGGEGFILQKLTGPGLAFVELDGEIVEYTLEAGQVMMVDTGFVAMYEPTVDFDIEMVRGVKNIFFGGEGLFLAHARPRADLVADDAHVQPGAQDRCLCQPAQRRREHRRERRGRCGERAAGQLAVCRRDKLFHNRNRHLTAD